MAKDLTNPAYADSIVNRFTTEKTRTWYGRRRWLVWDHREGREAPVSLHRRLTEYSAERARIVLMRFEVIQRKGW